MRSLARNLRATTITVSVLASLLLASCSITSRTTPYPVTWVPIELGHSENSCPNLEGIFYDRGEYESNSSGRPCDYKAGECASLIFGLLFDAHFGAGLIGTPAITRDGLEQVHIAQPSEGIVEIIAKLGGERKTLSKVNGDFTCDRDGLRLKGKTAKMVFLISNGFSFESRTFNIAKDGSLIMKSERRNVGHHTLFPFDVTGDGWARWNRVPADGGHSNFPGTK